MASKRKVAIFDVDGTIFRSSLLIELVEQLIKDGIFPVTARSDYKKEFSAWRDRVGGYEEYIMAVVKSFVKNIKGVYYGDFVEAGERMVAEQKKRVYRYTRDFLKDLKKEKYFLPLFRPHHTALLLDGS